MSFLLSCENFCNPCSGRTDFGAYGEHQQTARPSAKGIDVTPPHTQVPPRKVLSLKLRVRRFFTDHPDEELTAAQFRDKFNCSEATRRWIMVALGGEGGEIESVHVIRLRVKGIAKEIA